LKYNLKKLLKKTHKKEEKLQKKKTRRRKRLSVVGPSFFFNVTRADHRPNIF
jgi:hypothetical protein